MARWYEVRLDAAEAAITRAMAHVQERCAKAAETCAFGADIPRRIRALPPEEVT
jgi:hypothetical protein